MLSVPESGVAMPRRQVPFMRFEVDAPIKRRST